MKKVIEDFSIAISIRYYLKNGDSNKISRMRVWPTGNGAGTLRQGITLPAALLLLMNTLLSAQADLIFRNGPIYTLEAPGQRVEALATKGERILFTGPWEDARAFIGDSTRIIDLQGKPLLPGFTDSHVHPISGGLALLGCDLTGIEHPDSILAFLKNYAEAHPEKEWVRADNFWLATFPNGNPKKEWLDAIIPGRPAYVTSADGHSAWVNSKALELAGITSETPDPPNGMIERDEHTNEPTGTLREEAMALAGKLIPPYTHEELVAGLRKGLEVASSLGITNLVEASAGENYVNAYLELAEAEELPAHVNISIRGDISKGVEGARQVLALNEKYRARIPDTSAQKPDLTFNQVKFFMDGVVEGKTAAMLSHYHGDTHSGILNANPDTAIAAITALDQAGMQIHVHAIGDRGIRTTLDAFEQARKQNGSRDSRHHIAHLHVIHPDDIPRFRALDVIANFQALWATLEDSYMTDLNYPYLGEERVEWQYPIGTVARSGGRLAFGSDWDVSTMDPFDAIQVAVTRRGPDSTVREPWTPQHLVDVQTAVEGYTKGGAFLTFREYEIGTLASGKLADLIILDRDIFRCPTFEIYQTKVVMTLFRGKVVYGPVD
ncbi:MAG: amidohydrolase [Phaeodactylibacter sp.]|nr:amidohydrolase [Phaeodactylibacter sp.]